MAPEKNTQSYLLVKPFATSTNQILSLPYLL